MEYDRILQLVMKPWRRGGWKAVIPTSAVTSLLYRIVAEATLRRGAQYLLLLLIEIWLEHVKGLN